MLPGTQHRVCFISLCTTESKQINPNWFFSLPLSRKRNMSTARVHAAGIYPRPCQRGVGDVADHHFPAVVYHELPLGPNKLWGLNLSSRNAYFHVFSCFVRRPARSRISAPQRAAAKQVITRHRSTCSASPASLSPDLSCGCSKSACLQSAGQQKAQQAQAH